MSTAATPPDAVLASFKKQAIWCRQLGSPFSAQVLASLGADIEAGGPLADMIEGWGGDPVSDALPLRVLGALHALVLTGASPALAAFYPPRDGGLDDALHYAIRAALSAHADFIRGFLANAPQTNEVGRSAVLLGGFLEVARSTGLPLRLLEIGASAGLNMIWDAYGYRFDGATPGAAVWGHAASPVQLAPIWRGGLPPLDTPIHIISRAGCDLAPVDLADDNARLRLRAFVWADQRPRLSRLDSAIDLARRAGHLVAQADAADWVRGRLRQVENGAATVLYHSIMWQYMPAATRDNVYVSIARAGALATSAAPFAWLRFEPPSPESMPDLRLTLWPGGTERVLATAHPHGHSIAWAA